MSCGRAPAGRRLLADAARAHGRGHDGALGFGDVAGLQHARIGALLEPLLAEEQAQPGVVGQEERGAGRMQHAEQAIDDLLGQVGRAGRSGEGLQHVPQQAHVAVVLVGAAGEDAEQAIGRWSGQRPALAPPRHDLLAAALTGHAERLVGALQQVERIERLEVVGLGRDHAHGAAQVHGALQEGVRRDMAAHALGHQYGAVGADVAERQREDGAAVAHEHVGAAQQPVHRLDELANHAVAGLAAVQFVDAVESDRVDEQERARHAPPAGALDIGAEHALELVTPGQAGERVGQHRVDADDGRGEGMRAHRDLAGQRLRRQPQPHPAGHRRGLPLILGAALRVQQRGGIARDAAGPQAGQQRHGHQVAVARGARDQRIEGHRGPLPGAALEHRPGERGGGLGGGQFRQRRRGAGMNQHHRRAGVPRRRQVHRRRTRPGLVDEELELSLETLGSAHVPDHCIGSPKPKFSAASRKKRCRRDVV